MIRQRQVVCCLFLCCLVIKGNLPSDGGQAGHGLCDWPIGHTQAVCVRVYLSAPTSSPWTCKSIVCASVCVNSDFIIACIHAQPVEWSSSYPVELLCFVPGEWVCVLFWHWLVKCLFPCLLHLSRFRAQSSKKIWTNAKHQHSSQ